MGFFDTLGSALGLKGKANIFSYQDSGTSPVRDEDGRVIVSVAGGKDKEWRLNIKNLESVPLALSGKPKGVDEEIDRTVGLLLALDRDSEFQNSVIAKTRSGETIGWILKDDSEQFVHMLKQLDLGVRNSDRELSDRAFVFEFACHIEGMWDEDESSDGKLFPVAGIESVHVTMRLPAVLDIKGT